jgi:uncharacterized protein YqeY
MSELLKQIKADQVAARKARNTQEATVLTTLLGEAGPSGNDVVTDEQVTKVVQKFLKNLHDVIGYTANSEVQDRMKEEIAILERYQPAQLTEDKIRQFATEALADLADEPAGKRVGMVMKQLTEKYRGQYDGKVASQIVKDLV